MTDAPESEAPTARNNPLIWIALVVIGLILFVFIGGDRGQSKVDDSADADTETVGTIDRSLLVPPGMRARQYIQQLREDGDPYPLEQVFARAGEYSAEGSLADAHLLYFFAAREDHLPSIMKMGEMSDPTRFQAADSLLDDADAIQAYKWYQKAAALGHTPAAEHMAGLQQWAETESGAGNPQARQLLLNTQ